MLKNSLKKTFGDSQIVTRQFDYELLDRIQIKTSILAEALEKATILAENNTEIQNALSGTQLAISNYLYRVFKTTQIWDIEDPRSCSTRRISRTCEENFTEQKWYSETCLLSESKFY